MRETMEVYHPNGGGPRGIYVDEWPAHESKGFLKMGEAKPAKVAEPVEAEPEVEEAEEE